MNSVYHFNFKTDYFLTSVVALDVLAVHLLMFSEYIYIYIN